MDATKPSESPAPPRLAFIDAEFTALDVEHPKVLLLEVGMAITDVNLNYLGGDRATIRYTPRELNDAKWAREALEMHRDNGILEDIVSNTAMTIRDAERRMLRLLVRYAGVDITTRPNCPGEGSADPSAPIWGGCSPWKDRAIIRRHMPRFYERVHYRTLDATTLKLALEWWLGVDTHRAHKPHRALEDAISASQLANKLRRILIGRRSAKEEQQEPCKT